MDKIDAIIQETIYQNPNLDKVQRERLELVIKNFNNFFYYNYGVEVSLENAAVLFKTVKVVNTKIGPTCEKAFTYDINTNIITDNRRFIKDDSRRFYDYLNVVLTMLTKKYNPETGTYDDGLIVKYPNGYSFGEKINEKLKHTMLLLMTGTTFNEEEISDFYIDKIDDPCTLEDSLLIDINSFISVKDLLTYFVNSDGIQFYQNICEKLGNNDEDTINFFFNIDSYTRKNSIDNRKKYDEYMNKIRENSLEILDENSKKIA